jgi:CBS domain-containing protein
VLKPSAAAQPDPGRRTLLRVDQVMRKDVPRLRPSDPLSRAAQILQETGSGLVPVVAGDGSNRMVGTVTEREVCVGSYRRGLAPSHIFVGSVMVQHVHACTPGTLLEDAVRLMERAQVERLPVVDEAGALVGIVSHDAAADVRGESDGGGWRAFWRRMARLPYARARRAPAA